MRCSSRRRAAAVTVSTSSRWMSKLNANSSPAWARTSPLGKSMRIASSPARSTSVAPTPARSVGAIASSGRHHACNVASRSGVGVCQVARNSLDPWQPVGLVLGEVGGLVGEDRGDLVVGERMGDGALATLEVDRRAGDRQDPVTAVLGQQVEEDPLIGEDAQLVAGDHVETEQLGVEERRRAGARHDGAGVDRLDVAHRPGELAVDLGVDELAHPLRRLVVDHRVPDRPAVLQPVQVDRSVAAQRVEVGGAAVVLVDEDRRCRRRRRAPSRRRGRR